MRTASARTCVLIASQLLIGMAVSLLAVTLLLNPTAVPHLRLVNPAAVVATVAREAIDRLARSFRRMRASSHVCALDLPPEIVLLITAHLDDCALASLSLTCRSLHGLWKRRSPSLGLTEKEKLLLLLEKDTPSVYYCHQCVKLHHWHGRWSRRLPPVSVEHLPCKWDPHKQLFLVLTCHIPYFHARLVMNRHFYGPNHGVPLHIFNNRAQSYTRWDEITISESQHAHIFNDQLLLMTGMSYAHAKGDAVALRLHIDSHAGEVCQHLTLTTLGSRGVPMEFPTELPAMAWRQIPLQLPELAKKGNEPGQFLACGPSFGSCVFCLTDYSITIRWLGERKGYKIEVFVYRRLGDCRTPFDFHWRSVSPVRLREEFRSTHSPDDRPGSVRDQWNKACDMAETKHRAWWRGIGR